MRNRALCFVLAATLIVTFSLPAQTLLRGKGNFFLDVDYSRFFGDERQVYVEVYYGIHENSLSYVPGGNGYTGGVKMHLVVTSTLNAGSVADKEWLVPHEIADSAKMLSPQILTGFESVALPEGTYALRLLASDINDPARKDSVGLSFPVTLFPKMKEGMSDLELCTMIQSSSNTQSLFYKNTLEVTPNPARLFGVGLPIVYYYFELYNLDSSGSASIAVLRTTVINAAGKEVYSKDKVKSRALNSSVEVGTINLSTMRGGTYIVRETLIDSSKGFTLASSAKKFFVYKPGMAPDSSGLQGREEMAGSEYAVMTDEEINREIGFIGYLMSEAEKNQINGVTDLAGKQKFLFEFWRNRNPDPRSGENSFKKEYMQRIDYANMNYTGGLRKGWKSDRGRVHVLYGTPDEIERFPNSPEANPYEIWHYQNIQGGVEFVFVDRSQMEDYSLVHSTHRNELHDPEWFQDFAAKAK